MRYDVKNTVFVTFVPEVHIQKKFLKTICMYIIQIPLQNKSEFQNLQLFVVTFVMRCSRRAFHVV